MVIRDLTSCLVCVRGRTDALRMHNLRDCTVLAGPVHGSAFIEGGSLPCIVLLTGMCWQCYVGSLQQGQLRSMLLCRRGELHSYP